jgi:uncharacterized protein (UPF0332 family)
MGKHIVDAKEFLDSAYQILQGAKGEVDYRNAASRAYYAAYHLAEKRVGESATMGASHERIITALKGSPHQQERSLGNQLQQIKRSRVWADYRLDEDFPRIESNKVLKIVKSFYETK